MWIGLLGPLEVRAGDGSAVEVGGSRLRVLVTLLALEPGRVVSAARLVDGVWGDNPPGGAGNALQSLVSRLRRLLPDGVVQARPGGYLLDVGGGAVDHLRFEDLVARARTAGEPGAAAGLLRQAEALWRGPALADAGDAEFARPWRARLDEPRLAATEDRLEAELRIGERVVAELEALVAAHPLRERLVGLLMRALADAGRGADALAAFERCRGRLADELGADPSAALLEVHAQVLRGEAEPERREPTAGNLRAALTSFVGRDTDVGAVRALVAANRLVTLVGPGGAGKTRLAVETGRALGERPGVADEVWLVELAPVTDPADVIQAVWGALGLRDPAGKPGPGRRFEPEDSPKRLAAALAHRRLLLVLDNCEHVVAAAAQLAERLLGEAPHLRVLATSREPLGITGEALYSVGPLGAGAAGQLFRDRAAAVRPGAAADGDAVGRICRALDGLPLAIELAAARCRSLTPAHIADRLDDRFRLLTRGSRTALPRHQTLRQVVDWSWDLLSAPERAMLRRLAIFPGGATAAAAAAVCDPDGRLGETDELLTDLAEKSLLVAGDDLRYRMLETIRAYGLERLDEHGETDELRRRHGAWFLALAQRREPDLRGHDQLAALAELGAEHDNLHGALRRAIAAGDSDLAVRLVAVVGWYWWLGGHRVEGAALASAALSMPGPADPDARALACGVAAVNGFDGLTDTEMLDDWFAEAIGYQGSHPLFRLFQAVAGLYREGPVDAVLERITALSEDPDPWIAGLGRLLVGHTLLNTGARTAESRAAFEASLEAFQGIGERWGMAFALAALAETKAQEGRPLEAIAHFEEALTYLRQLGATEDRPVTEVRLAQQYDIVGDRERADACYAEARRTARRSAVPDSIAFVEYAYAYRALRCDALDEARARFARTLEIIGTHRVSPQMLGLVHGGRAVVFALDGDHAAARESTRRAVTLGRSAFDAPMIATVVADGAEAALLAGDPRRAAVLLAAAEAMRGGTGEAWPWTTNVYESTRAALTPPELAATAEQGGRATLENILEYFPES
ncbi:BTAD domain-containing putative transcriptional regulator [Dactylosporangium matsuzakiense]|uniref:SARP family transcriptional regulator n=1 Tax=Dactylosporangium matsuzakiense TaxID=53360 RepID=A0A9W6NM65_9ACTN|nr:BTAD domain-containing putative transcriptional regulator [Dactylosporangium matsuzakiense]UWZ47570.1 winged helix-turn-helix domain-containing protein [Dactylosporangium matsuzakiense]GLL01602.1 SARP family transcriptional regulator [Dactylosporangium matsuzakiense]